MDMRTGDFTPGAAVMWGMITKASREGILHNVYCTKCRAEVQMSNFTGKEGKGILILRGSCATCGQEVVRVLEEPEGKPSLN